jgi:hypothetical protein
LTVNFGVRYEYTDLPQPDQGKFGCVGAGTCPEFAGLPTNIQALAGRMNQDKNNWGPRVAFAWDVGGRQNFLIRAGYGLYYGRTSNSALASGLFENDAITRFTIEIRPPDDDPDNVSPVFPITFCNPPLGTPGQDSTCAPPAGVSGDVNLSFFSGDYVRPLIHSGEFELEYAVTPNTSLSATYLVSRGQRLPYFPDININPADPGEIVRFIDDTNGNVLGELPVYVNGRPFTDFGEVIQAQSVVDSWYNAMVLRAKPGCSSTSTTPGPRRWTTTKTARPSSPSSRRALILLTGSATTVRPISTSPTSSPATSSGIHPSRGSKTPGSATPLRALSSAASLPCATVVHSQKTSTSSASTAASHPSAPTATAATIAPPGWAATLLKPAASAALTSASRANSAGVKARSLSSSGRLSTSSTAPISRASRTTPGTRWAPSRWAT